jgi:hypothetical protein
VCLLRGTDWIFTYNLTFCPHSVFMCFVWISEQETFSSAGTCIYHYSFNDATSWKLRRRFLHHMSTSDSRLPLQTAVTSTHNTSLVPAVNIQSQSEVRVADCHSHCSFEFSTKHCVPVAIPQHEPSDTAQWRHLNYIRARITIH